MTWKKPGAYCVSNGIMQGARTELFETHPQSGLSLGNRDKLDPYVCVSRAMGMIVTVYVEFLLFGNGVKQCWFRDFRSGLT
jgi:hypothetical protein